MISYYEIQDSRQPATPISPPTYQAIKGHEHTSYQPIQDPESAARYWQDLFRPVGAQPQLHSFPLDHQWPRSETTIRAPEHLFEAALEFSGRYDIRLDDLIYGIWALVSIRHTAGGQRTAIFTVAGRDRSFFGYDAVNGLEGQDFPLVLSVPEEMDALSWIRHVGTVSAKASTHAYIGYKQILKRTSAGHPQVKVSIIQDDSEEEVMTADADFPLVLNLSASSGLKLSMRHNLAVPRTNVRVLLDHFAATLQHVVENPQSNISALNITSPAERQLIHEYGKAAIRARSGLVHSLIEKQARLRPDAHAIQFELDTPISYSTLNKRSNQLARYLRQYGASYIPVHMRTSADFIIALLAILKAGAAYVILDPDAPATRKSFIVEDVHADFVLVDSDTAGTFPREHKVRDLLSESMGNDESDLAIDQDANDVAYVIYTSGSTGKPKAVLLEHQAAYNGLLAFPRMTDLRQLLFFNPVFSAAQRSIWATLSVGGCLCLASKANLTVHIARTINSMHISSVDMTSTTAALLSPESVPSLRRMVLGGELVNPAVVQTWAHRVELLSSYGLSECTQLNWRYRLQGDQSSRIIGQPFDTTTSYILTPGTTTLSPLLIPGELCLGGAQLARGYLNNPDETGRRFIPNPFGQGKLYRTGDMAVRHADGSIEMIGRIDFQVKINGQRVDPAEPNAVIQSFEEVKQSAVVPATLGGKTALVAVIVSRADGDWESLVGNLRSYVATRVPLYMVPGFWIPMAALPLNANGKVDMPAIRKIVEDLGQSGQLMPDRPKHETNGVSLTDNEKVIRSVWARFLSFSESDISSEDSFISLGGTSLEAIQVVSQLQTEHSLILRVEDIILAHSLSDVASLIQQKPGAKVVNGHAAPFALLRETPSLERFGINLAEVEDAFPVTPFQEAIIANTMMGGTKYIYSRSYSFAGHSYDAVRNALVSLMKSELFLRSTFVPDGVSFMQVVQKTADLPWESSQMDLKAYMQEQISKPMQAGGLWWRAAALPGNILVITIHHALFDYWSSEFLPEDLTSLLLGSAPAQRPAFSRYAEHQQQHDEVTMQKFWKGYLDGAVPTRLGSHTEHQTMVAANLGNDMKATASNLKVTPSMLLYAAWSIVLSLTGSTDDVVMGVTLSGREAPIPGILQMSGPTLMIAPLRVKVNKASSFEAHLGAVQYSLWDVARHAQYGLRKILKVSRQPKDLFDTTVNFLIKVAMPTPPGGLKVLPEKNYGTHDYIKLELSNDSLDRITLSSTLDPAYAQMLVDSVAVILQTASDAPLTKLGQLELVQSTGRVISGLEKVVDGPVEEVAHSEPRYASKTEDRSSTSTYQDNELGHSAFHRIACSYPSRTAVEDAAGNSITYAGMAIKVNQLAGLLRAKGVVLEQVVPLLLEKSISTIVAMLGVLVSGGAFLPLGPENPRERNLGIMEDSEAKVVITDRQNASFFDDLVYDVIIIDALDWETMPIKREIVPELRPDSLAYLIYTSGSTGKPKGTLLTHRALATAVEGIIESTNMDNSHRILWALNYTFDGSFFSLFAALATGCTLCVAPQSTIVANLAGLINSMKVTAVCVTPTMAGLFHPDDVPTLEVLATGGEPVTPHMQTVWAPRIPVFSAYGPTEATICVTTTAVTPDMNLRNIGRPYRNVTAQILDPDTLEQVPFGEVGELCVAGPQLARGYLKRPDATDKVFRNQPGGRIYQTGDLARWLPTGEIELFGRKDDQVKINGYRIELGEIESVIMQTGLFNQCAVIAANVLKKKQLVAFCSASAPVPGEAKMKLLPPAQAPNMEEVKEQLITLPKYMVPSIWLPLSDFPLMVSGKIDRKRLLALAEGMADDELKEYLPAEEVSEISTDAERKLQLLWSKLFDTPAEDIHANSTFHALGGDSISALNLVSLLRQDGYKVRVNDILTSRTLREQATLLVDESEAVVAAAATPAPVPAVAFQATDAMYERLSQMGVSRSDVEDIYPCSPGQIEFLTQGNKQEQFWQLMAVRSLPADLDFDQWISLAMTLTQNSQILRALYLYADDQRDPRTAVQVVLKDPSLNLTYHTYHTDEEKEQIISADWEQRFDPSKPFVRYTLLTHASTGTRDLVIKLDHASYDGTLLHIFDDQFKALARNSPLPPLTPFKDYINYTSSIPKQPQLTYWKNLLPSSPFTFPSQLTNPKLSRLETRPISSTIGIDSLATTAGVTAPIVFQTAFSLLLSHLSSSHAVTYDNLITGRNVPLPNPQLIDGTCANFLPFHSTIDPSQPITDLLQSTQRAFWDASENGLVSLSDIYDALDMDRTTAAAKCLFCFQPFDPVSAGELEDSMRWIVMKMSKNKMLFNYAVQLEVVKAKGKGEYVLRFAFDERAFQSEEVTRALDWYVGCLEGMAGGEVTVSSHYI
ncbi:non-ribosomal peptide synthetase [Aspergillus sclerotioniger CBS 115572]|uniref:Non-ribosomal peptide synthetase n=1 Tax=Aspergillus sclerotioniger CBS 115572 TaxID=1450535 RepID=A0A317WQ51_9EURO|nr:non-ribosomal peptide synthetase [Aspergillus sclerotioniger CBS 115572]PWY87257.1 non-ribosomal peptide synthetase [Aspergillus sclerotioniger CBS 115572]